ncbi:hypothetical protein B0F90DRAFT_1777947 [Multifurca ochricompacta]|uniref:Uncharacterized protein n=1 Tax=Multifurca ochricompacta TaxID=376703 RepID=A0AAD4LUM8_9AGAM|nr:hypothetical protein B0F90DRAFT_1777947 [Multifurca ochricompacta]
MVEQPGGSLIMGAALSVDEIKALLEFEFEYLLTFHSPLFWTSAWTAFLRTVLVLFACRACFSTVSASPAQFLTLVFWVICYPGAVIAVPRRLNETLDVSASLCFRDKLLRGIAA